MNTRFQIALILAALVVFATTFSLATRPSRGQSTNSKTASPVKPTVLITERNSPSKSNLSSSFAGAAARNAILRNELIWTFGRKLQRGWYLYDLLISQTLKTDSDTSTPEFAEALANWQQRTGLEPSGALDEDSFMAMVSEWQGNRLKSRTLAEPHQLVTLPATDFYDLERLVELRQVERNAYVAYKEMIAAALADPRLKLDRNEPNDLAPTERFFKIISSFRTREYQEWLRQRSPNAGSAGLAVNSPHFTGRALDIYVGGDPVDTRDSNRAIQVNSPAYKWLVRNAERFGFRPYFYEPWHWEYVR